MRNSMTRRLIAGRLSRSLASLAVAGGLALGLLLLPSAAVARDKDGYRAPGHSYHNKHYKKHDKKHHRGHGKFQHHQRPVYGPVQGYRGRPFVVPHRIHTHDAVSYRPYLATRLYYRPHGHYHDVYRFPVRTEIGIAYTPHSYCGNDLHVRGSFSYRGENFGIRVGF